MSAPRPGRRSRTPQSSWTLKRRPATAVQRRKRNAASETSSAPSETRLIRRARLQELQSEVDRISNRINKIEGVTADIVQQQQYEKSIPAELRKTFKEVNTLVYNLNRNYYTEAETIRDQAATKINACARGYLARRRYQRARRSFLRFQQSETEVVRRFLVDWVSKKMVLQHKVGRIWHRETKRVAVQALRAWNDYAAHLVAARKERCQQEEVLIHKHELMLLRKCMLEWLRMATGPSSRKIIVVSYKARKKDAEEKLMRTVPFDVDITNDMVREQMNSVSVFVCREKARVRSLREHFMPWCNLATHNEERNFQKKYHVASKHCKYKRLQRTFAAWRRFAASISAEERRPVVRLRNVRVGKYEEEFAVLRRCFLPWFRYTRFQTARVRLERNRHTRMKRQCVRGWWHATTRQRELKTIVLERWILCASFTKQIAFRSWYLWLQDRKAMSKTVSVLSNVWIRRRRRRALQSTFKAWHLLVRRAVTGHNLEEDNAYLLKENEMLRHNDELSNDIIREAEREVELVTTKLKRITGERAQQDKTLQGLRMSYHVVSTELLRIEALLEKTAMKHFIQPRNMLAAPPGDELAPPPPPVALTPREHDGASSSEQVHGVRPAPVVHVENEHGEPQSMLHAEKDDSEDSDREPKDGGMHTDTSGMSPEDAQLLVRAKAVISTARTRRPYAPPIVGGSIQDVEIRRLSALLEFLLTGRQVVVDMTATVDPTDLAQVSGPRKNAGAQTVSLLSDDKACQAPESDHLSRSSPARVFAGDFSTLPALKDEELEISATSLGALMTSDLAGSSGSVPWEGSIASPSRDAAVSENARARLRARARGPPPADDEMKGLTLSSKSLAALLGELPAGSSGRSSPLGRQRTTRPVAKTGAPSRAKPGRNRERESKLPNFRARSKGASQSGIGGSSFARPMSAKLPDRQPPIAAFSPTVRKRF